MSEHEQIKLPRPHRWLVVLIAALIFISGLAVGAGGATFFILRHAQQRMQNPERIPGLTVESLRWKLGLTDKQAAKVEQILRERMTAFQEIRREVQPQVEAQLELVRTRISEVLTPEQKAKWDEIYSRRRPFMPGRNRDGARPEKRRYPRGTPSPPPVSEETKP